MLCFLLMNSSAVICRNVLVEKVTINTVVNRKEKLWINSIENQRRPNGEKLIPRILATKMILLILVCPDWFYFYGLWAIPNGVGQFGLLFVKRTLHGHLLSSSYQCVTFSKITLTRWRLAQFKNYIESTFYTTWWYVCVYVCCMCV